MVPTLQTTDRGYLFGPSARGKSALETKKNLAETVRQQKEKEIFDNAVESLETFWNGKRFDGFPISSKGQMSDETNAPYCDYEEIHELTKNQRRHCNTLILLNIFKFAMEHGDRRNG